MTFPYRKIMCPVDFDDSSLEAVDTAASVARQNEATITLVHIVPMIIEPTGLPIYGDLYKVQEETARHQLAEIVHTRLSGIKCEVVLYNGEPAQTILSIAKKLAPDLIVMATHGRKGFSHFFLGSVAESVLRGATCPVLTVHGTPRIEETVTVDYQGYKLRENPSAGRWEIFWKDKKVGSDFARKADAEEWIDDQFPSHRF